MHDSTYLEGVLCSTLRWFVLDDPGIVEFHRLSRVIAIFAVLYLNYLALVVCTVSKNNILLFVCLREREREKKKKKGKGAGRERERERGVT